MSKTIIHIPSEKSLHIPRGISMKFDYATLNNVTITLGSTADISDALNVFSNEKCVLEGTNRNTGKEELLQKTDYCIDGSGDRWITVYDAPGSRYSEILAEGEISLHGRVTGELSIYSSE